MSDTPSIITTLVGSLAPGTRLHEYRIERVLGHGGFGITYLARDTHLDKKVAIKEYLPNDLAARAPDQTVTVRSPDSAEAFQWGLQSFIKEARVLAKFSHPSLIQVHRYFEANETAYFVMEYAEGVTLSTVLKHEGNLDEDRVRKIIFPILNGLEEVHRLGVLHRDIKPDNIILREGAQAVLIDFGAARQNLSSMTRSVMSVLTAGYAPIEQYASGGNQGAWTDLYALGAVAYRALSGKKPIDAINRIRDDPMVPAATLGKGRYTDHFLAAIDWALAVNPEDRPTSVAEFKLALDGMLVPPQAVAPARGAGRGELTPVARRQLPEIPEAQDHTVISALQHQPSARPAWRKPAIIGGVVLAAAIGAAVLLTRSPAPTDPAPTDPATTDPATSAPAATGKTKPAPGQGKPPRGATAVPPSGAPRQAEPSPKPATEPPPPAAEPTPSTTTAEPAPPPAAEPAPSTAKPAAPKPAPQQAPKPKPEQQTPKPKPEQQAPKPKPEQPAKVPPTKVQPVAAMPPLAAFQDCPHCPLMVPLAVGAYQMGAQPADNGNAWEGPPHAVQLSRPFAIGRNEVTGDEWRACVAAKACAPAAPGPVSGDAAQAPVVNVTWNDAQTYVAWLSRSTGRAYRLPTESEWEFAIRARTASARYWGGDRRLQCRYGNGADQAALKRDPKLSGAECTDGFAVLAPTGKFEPNAFGLYDMAGNAWEWVQDCWKDSYRGAPADGRAYEEAGCTQRVIRGGSWRSKPNSLRSFGRGNSPANTRSEDLGLRVVAE